MIFSLHGGEMGRRVAVIDSVWGAGTTVRAGEGEKTGKFSAFLSSPDTSAADADGNGGRGEKGAGRGVVPCVSSFLSRAGANHP